MTRAGSSTTASGTGGNIKQTALHLQTYFDRIRPFRLKDAVNNIVSSAARPSDDLSGCAELVACMRSNMLQCYRRPTTSHV